MVGAPSEFSAALVDPLVATTKHESPYCVAAAGAALGHISRNEDVAVKLIMDSGAVPALIRVMETAGPREDLSKASGLYRGYAPNHAVCPLS